MNIYTVMAGVGKLAEILANLFILAGIPIVIVMAPDRYTKNWRGQRYYWLALTLIVSAGVLLFSLIYGLAVKTR